MRNSLRKSLEESPVTGFERYPRGSIVLCNTCALPIYKLEAGIALGDKGGRCASIFKPISLDDLADLAQRPDIDAGIRACVASWTPAQRRQHLSVIGEPKSGDPMLCPVCLRCFVQVLSVEKTETLDQAYVLELLTIPPYGTATPAPVRGKHFDGDRGDWVH